MKSSIQISTIFSRWAAAVGPDEHDAHVYLVDAG
jgi:hypothetical protein